MKKDIEIPEVKDVHIALIYEFNEDFRANEWNAYLLNDKDTAIELVFISSKGFDGDLKTSLMRHSMSGLEAKSFEKIEYVQDEVLNLNNEFLLTYYFEGVLFEKRFVFKKGTVSEKNLTKIPLLDKKGILANG